MNKITERIARLSNRLRELNEEIFRLEALVKAKTAPAREMLEKLSSLKEDRALLEKRLRQLRLAGGEALTILGSGLTQAGKVLSVAGREAWQALRALRER